MNPSTWNALPGACTPASQGSYGPDQISKVLYDAAGEVIQLREGVGTGDEAAERTLTYTNNGQVQNLTDGENNKTAYVYDGFDRLSQTQYPNPTKGSGTSNTADFEQLSYDANGNVTSRRLRDGQSIAYGYDNLDRMVSKNLPGTEPDVSFGYDNLDRMTSATQSGIALSFNWDALGRKTSEAGPQGTTTFGYDPAGRKTSITYSTNGGGSPLTVAYAYLATGKLSSITQGGSNVATYAYDDLGNRTSATFGNGAVQNFTYDPVSRLSQLTNDLSGTTNDLTAAFAYSPANQISSTTRAGDAYAWSAYGSGTTNYTSNGLNQQVSIAGASATWDSKGNLTTEPQSGKTYGYSSENLLTSASGGVTLGYDPAMRLYQVAGAATTRFAYDGPDAIAEYNSSNALLRRYVFDPTTNQPVVQYEGTGTTAPRYLSQDERGSVISQSDATGALIGPVPNTYDEYGQPGAGNNGRYQYTGQKWIGEAGLYDYKARDYVPQLGLFAQTDPAAYGDSANVYVYVGDDPVNLVDPLGLQETNGAEQIVIVGDASQCPHNAECQYFDPLRGAVVDVVNRTADIVVTGYRRSTPFVISEGRYVPNPNYRNPTQCIVGALKKNALGLGLDVAGVAASLTGLKAAWRAGSAAVGATTALLSVTAASLAGSNRDQAVALGGAATAIGAPLFPGGESKAAKVVGSSLPLAGAAVSGAILGYDVFNAINEAGCL